MTKIKTTPFDSAEYLDSEEVQIEYLRLAGESGDTDEFMIALGDVARARSMAKLAQDTGLGRESLYKALREGASPRYDTVVRVLKAMGLRIRVEPING